MSRAPVRRTFALACATVSAAALVAGCSGSGSSPSAAPTPTVAPTPTCPSVAPSPSASSKQASAQLTKVLRQVPFDLPMPDHITAVDTSVTTDGIRVARFTTPTSMRESVLFVVGRYPKAGYVLGRGDAEATEADAPFVKGTVRGLARLAAVDTCRTLWLIASTSVKSGVTGGTSPLLSPHPTSSVTSALPFG